MFSKEKTVHGERELFIAIFYYRLESLTQTRNKIDLLPNQGRHNQKREQVDLGHQTDADSHQRDADLSDDSDYEVYRTQVPVP